MIRRAGVALQVALTWMASIYVGSLFVFFLSPSPQLLECPGTNVHVWDLDQCAAFNKGSGFGGGGGGPCGALCNVGKVLDGLTGGIL